MPYFSITIPVYNVEDYLENCIESIEMQTYPKIEVIIVNDGSTDRTSDICRKLTDKYHNIQVIDRNDEGVSAARNAGIAKASGENQTKLRAAAEKLLEAFGEKVKRNG